jgi:hypothetical protein
MIRKPEPHEHAPYYTPRIALTPPDAMASLRMSSAATPALLAGLSDVQAAYRYAPGKWSVREVLGHVMDVERVLAYRAMAIARGDTQAWPGFDENAWVPAGRFEARPLASLIDEYRTVRAATIALFASCEGVVLERIGTASGHPLSVRAAAHIIAGHELHHVAILKERYGLA